MDDFVFWLLARALGLTAFAALSLSILSGVALRTSVLDFVASNRSIRRLHDFMTPLWLPLGAGHVLLLLFDTTARIGARDLVVPFRTDYGQLAIGLGTVSLDIFAIVVLTSWVRGRMPNALWTWIHRTSYPAFVALFFHSVLAGTDFAAPPVSAIAWSVAAALAVLVFSRLVWGRLSP